MNLGQKADKIVAEAYTNYQTYDGRRRTTEQLKHLVKDEVELWLEEMGISGNVTLSLFTRMKLVFPKKAGVRQSSEYVRPLSYRISYIAVWNRHLGLKSNRSWMNKIVVNPRTGTYALAMGHTYNLTAVKVTAMTDPAYTFAMGWRLSGRILNVMAEIDWAIRRAG